MLRRIDRVKPFALVETMVPAAALMPATQVAIERHLVEGRAVLRHRVLGYLRWLRGPGRAAPPEQLQRRLTILRLSFNAALAQLDLFADAISQRSENETGVWLSGLDVAAQDALALPGGFYRSPPVVCYLHRGMGGAIRRARTRLPGGGENPVAIIRIPRERMIGFGISSSLVHEVGHQAAALLGLVESLRPVLQEVGRRADPGRQQAWIRWQRWISEIVADLWAVSRIGVSSTLGLISLVSLPRAFVFRSSLDDPHPFPWIRVKLSCAIGDTLHPHPQWAQLARVWEQLYPRAGLPAQTLQQLDVLEATIPDLVRVLLDHRPPALRGADLRQVLVLPDRSPHRLDALVAGWQRSPTAIAEVPPCVAFAGLGRARITGRLNPEAEDRVLGRLITHWALRSTLDLAEICAAPDSRTPSPSHPRSRPVDRIERPSLLRGAST